MDAGAAELRCGLVVATHGRHCAVEPDAGGRVICHPRGKKSTVVTGDRVLWAPSGDEGVIGQVQPRRNLLYRQDEVRTKAFAANLDQVLILLAAEPVFSEKQLVCALIAAQQAQIAPLLVLNKSDLAEAFDAAWRRLLPYRAMGLDVRGISLKHEAAAAADSLRKLLHHRTTLVLGPSGTGKSTLINLLVPGAQAQTAGISQALNSGRHTTTVTTLYHVGGERETALIDSPGFQSFGLHHIEARDLARYMPDMREHIADCRFANCTHMHEPDCAVMVAVAGPDAQTDNQPPNAISASRYRIYRELFQELSQAEVNARRQG